MKKRLLALLCAVLMLSGCSGQQSGAQSSDLMDGVSTAEISGDVALLAENTPELTDFSVRLFQSSLMPDKNTLVSPLSALYALGMTANGARQETLSQMESALGLDVETLNICLATLRGQDEHLKLANSIWFRDDGSFTAEPDFLAANASCYDAELYRAPFNQETLDSINSWVRWKTYQMIPSILEELSEDAMMYLINALAFEAEWQEPYELYQVSDGTFTLEDGTTRTVPMMHSTESLYLEDDRAIGVAKRYKDCDYAFVALLPEEGLSIADYTASLSGQGLSRLLADAEETDVITTIPKFETECSLDLKDALIAMGMEDAFDPQKADFSGMGSSELGPLYVSRILHKTYLCVDETGTRAAAATTADMAAGAIMLEDVKEVRLDRPFVYLLVDWETKLPVFLGTVMDPGA